MVSGKRYVALLMIAVMGLTGLMQYHHHDLLGHIFIHLSECHEHAGSNSDPQTAHHSHDNDCPLHLKECIEGKILYSTHPAISLSDGLASDIVDVSKSDGVALCGYFIDCECAVCSALSACPVLRAPPVIV